MDIRHISIRCWSAVHLVQRGMWWLLIYLTLNEYYNMHPVAVSTQVLRQPQGPAYPAGICYVAVQHHRQLQTPALLLQGCPHISAVACAFLYPASREDMVCQVPISVGMLGSGFHPLGAGSVAPLKAVAAAV